MYIAYIYKYKRFHDVTLHCDWFWSFYCNLNWTGWGEIYLISKRQNPSRQITGFCHDKNLVLEMRRVHHRGDDRSAPAAASDRRLPLRLAPLRLARLLISSSLLCMPEPGIDSMGIYHIMPNMFLYISNIWLCPTGFNRFHRYTFGQLIMVNMIQQLSTYICHIPTWNPKSIWSVDSIDINISNIWYIQIQLISKYNVYPHRFQHSI